MKELVSITKVYLSKDTNHAVLVRGKWGVGKTYFIKEVLKKEIVKIDVLNDASKKYKLVHVSLFGIKSIEEIQKEVLLTLNPFLKNSKIKLSIGIAKALGRGLMSFGQLGNIDDYISDIKPDNGDLLEVNELVICFDDLDRKDEGLSIEELIGYVNNLVENNGAKVILIANEDKIESEVYKDYKEKVIGLSVDFLPNIRATIESIIEKRYGDAFKDYAIFLTKRIDVIVELTEKNESNLRSLIFGLDSFHDIYSRISKDVLVNPDKKNLIDEKKWESIIRFSLGVAFEFKEGKVSISNKEELTKFFILEPSVLEFLSGGKISGADSKHEYINYFREKYFENSRIDYRFFDSVFNSIVGSQELIADTFVKEIEEAYNIKDNEVERQYTVLDTLKTGYDLSDKEYRKRVHEMLEFVDKGKYKLLDYTGVFTLATLFDNIIGFNPDKLSERIIRGIKRGKNTFDFVESVEIYTDNFDGHPLKDQVKRIHDFVVKTNAEIREEKLKEEIANLLNEMDTDFSSFVQKLSDSTNKLFHIPIFNNGSSYKIANIIKRLKYLEILDLKNLLTRRYLNTEIPMLEKELDFFIDLNKRLAPNSKKRKVKNKQNYYLNEICSVLEKVIKKLKAPKGIQ